MNTSSRLSKSARTRSLDANSLALAQSNIELAGQRVLRSVLAHDLRSSRLAVAAAGQPIGAALPPIRQQGDFSIALHLDLAHDTVAATVLAFSAAIRTQRILGHAQGISVLQRLGRSVERIRHVGVNSGDA